MRVRVGQLEKQFTLTLNAEIVHDWPMEDGPKKRWKRKPIKEWLG